MFPNRLESDLKRLRAIGNDRYENLLRRVCRAIATRQEHPSYPLLEKLRSWLLTPVFLWPVDIEILGRRAVDLIGCGRSLDEPISFLLQILTMPPKGNVVDAMLEFHRCQETNEWECFLRAAHKFDLRQQEVENRDDLKVMWCNARHLFVGRELENVEGLIAIPGTVLSRFVVESGLKWDRKEDRSRAIVRVFCHRWNLEGFDGEQPLLLRPRVFFNAYGTVIFIPSYWSFDCRRDFEWGVIMEIHRLRGAAKIGLSRGEGRVARQAESRRAKELMKTGRLQGLKGGKLMEWIKQQFGWHSNTPDCKLYRLLKMP